MKTALITHKAALAHETPPAHPEAAERIGAILEKLAAPQFDKLLRIDAPIAAFADIARAHPPAYIENIIAQNPEKGQIALDGDTFMSPGSCEAARRAAGGAIAGVSLLLEGKIANGFVAMRPPGHHAEHAQAMGFCLFNTIAIAAKYALEKAGLKRVAIVDFDVHHGNGTQDIFWNDPRALFISSHQMPLFPGTGADTETGAHNTILNIPLKPATQSAEFRQKWRETAFARIREFNPELILISAGFDAHRRDPLANIDLQTDDFRWITEEICALADTLCDGRVLSVLEGGYDLDCLAECVSAHINILLTYADKKT